MALDLTAVVKSDKNKLTSDSVYLIALEINVPTLEIPIRIVSNNENITWQGNLYSRFPFELEEISETSTNERSLFKIKASNINNIIGEYLRAYDVYVKKNGFEPVEIELYVLNTNDLDSGIPIVNYTLEMNKFSLNTFEITFFVSSKDIYKVSVPMNSMYPNNCRFNFKSVQCGYNGTQAMCDKSLKRCKALNNSSRYGGFALIGNTGVNL